MNNALGFACHWGPSRLDTWSGSPVRLYDALSREGPVVDIDVTLPPHLRVPLRALNARRDGPGWRSNWRHSRAGIALVEHRLRSRAREAEVSAILQVGDLGVVDQPYYVWQDLSFDLLLQNFGPEGVPHFRTLTRSDLNRLRARQQEVYDNATGILAMSQWLAASITASGVPADRVHVVHPGTNVKPRVTPPPERRQGPGRRLLFLGRDFDTKAGDQVLAAFALLRTHLGPSISLTVAGPRTWPVQGATVPDGVTFLGKVSPDAVVDLYDSHDLFVMPSRFEGFGIVFAEALGRGLPCIGRRACAMPEIIDEHSGGRLIDSDDSHELANAIESALVDDDLYDRCGAAASSRREHYTWSRAATQIHGIVDGSRGPRNV